MAINIKSPDCERLVRELADLTGDSITDAIHMAVRERLTREKLRKLGGVERSWQRIERIQERIRAFPLVTGELSAGADALGSGPEAQS
jgi:antitoxin VapB